MAIDNNHNGLIDNVCIIIAGTCTSAAKELLLLSRGALIVEITPTLINGKRMTEYLMIFSEGNGLSQSS